MRLPVRHALPFAALILAAGCGLGGGSAASSSAAPARNGPAADYPMVIGDPFTIDGTIYTPADRLNSDELGYASVGEAGGGGISAAHKTLPLPSYVEVTSLESGRTILIRIERRGPMSNDSLIELSPGAASQLELSGRAPVRVRRVNPPELDRAMLRRGERAPERMDTPKGLLAVLNRKLNPQQPLPSPTAEPSPAAILSPAPSATTKPESASSSMPSPTPAPKPSPLPEAQSTPSPVPTAPSKPPPPPAAARPATKPKTSEKPAAPGPFRVQVATFSSEERAKSAAGKLNGKVSKAGKFWLTRIGPFATRIDAQAALAKARAAGYSDARIQRAD